MEIKLRYLVSLLLRRIANVALKIFLQCSFLVVSFKFAVSPYGYSKRTITKNFSKESIPNISEGMEILGMFSKILGTYRDC